VAKSLIHSPFCSIYGMGGAERVKNCSSYHMIFDRSPIGLNPNVRLWMILIPYQANLPHFRQEKIKSTNKKHPTPIPNTNQ